MVVSPNECTALIEHEKNQLHSAETAIDSALRKNYYPGKSITITFNGISNQRVRDAIVSKYEAAGWSIKYIDQRDGDFLAFTHVPKDNAF